MTHVELRWLVWGFEGSDVPEPWADTQDGRWHVRPEESFAELVLGAWVRNTRGGVLR